MATFLCRWTGVIVLFASITGCACKEAGVVYQNSSIDALLDANYDGELTIAELKTHGNFGLGTFDALDGEMLLLDGVCYQVRSDGKAYVPNDTTKTPLGIVTWFKPDLSTDLSGPLDYKAMQSALDAKRPNNGRAYAARIDGTFTALRTRSVPRQEQPYRRLSDAVKTQPTFDLTNVRGTLVGFWYPESMRHLNVPGWHFHFITADRSAGGHVLSLTLESGIAQMQQLRTMEIALPETPPTTMPTDDRHGDLEAVEKGTGK